MNPPVQIPAIATNVASRARRTTLKMGTASLETVEHLGGFRPVGAGRSEGQQPQQAAAGDAG